MFRFRWIPLVVLVGIIVAQASASSGAGTALVVLPPGPSFDAGVVAEGEVIEHAFVLQNNGAKEVRILKVKPG